MKISYIIKETFNIDKDNKNTENYKYVKYIYIKIILKKNVK